ncbi:3-keto-steroid reductase [Pseudocercospora fuligena]|uniref:3-keto-steroid reductase n=1 Tax=Pseudocercospora fuligena TaxID=685502 RepID=A0A8H6RQ16_9PEZI|nr:3-keto-steroid reductase [Pseudocercospora fuligena]
MEVPASTNHDEKSTFTVLVTGANSGLGFALCCRLIDEFLFTRPQSQTLHLLFSTRDSKKSSSTLTLLNAHLQKTLREANGKTLGISRLLEPRIKLEGVLVDLLKLSTVKALAEQLLRRNEKLDAVVWNAGIAGWSGLSWGKAVWNVCTDLVHATTWPKYMVCDVGLRAKPQISPSSSERKGHDEEPVLGQVFLANVFGHYMLTHWLSPLFDSDTRIIWMSSISASAHTFSLEDLQGLRAEMSYESSKRLTDFLVLTSELNSTKPYINTFIPAKEKKRAKMFVVHPGVCGTAIAGLNWFIGLFMIASFYLARWLGSPWHPVEPYKGAVSAAFTVLSTQIPEMEETEGKGKWGSSTGVFGDERVARTEVDGWGYCGQVGKVPKGSVTTGLYRGRKDLTKEDREEFEVVGRQVWSQMEELRIEWERRLGPVSQESSVDV